jgi:5-methylthioadenosine/S-adenosylhomocysteine deaminase
VIEAAEAWAVATGARAPLLGATPLEPGAPADFLLLRRDAPELGIGDLTSDLVYAATGASVDTTVVAGKVLMRGGEIEGLDEIVAQAAERAHRLGL